MNALVISGGGSKGAYAGGLAEYLLTGCGKDYDLFIGTSTGGLLAPMLAAGKLDKAKKIFTSVNQKSIYKVSPFKIKKKGTNDFNITMNLSGITKLLLTNHKSFGDSSNLRELIKECFLKEDFDRIRKSGKKAIVTVSNLTNEKVEYKSTDDYEYDEFCDWMWASANAVPFMSLMIKDGIEYGDGGFGAAIPIQKAINESASQVDVIALRPMEKSVQTPHSKNVFQLLVKTFNFLLNQGSLDDITIGQLEAINKSVDIHFYFTPRILSEQVFVFDPEQMTNWWSEGYVKGENSTPKIHCVKCQKSILE
jgi:predicted patatin/cPLA2 family phospholipase